jgi:hypothetical protein
MGWRWQTYSPHTRRHMVLTSLTKREKGINEGDFMSCTQRNGADSFLISRQLCSYSIFLTFYGTRRFIVVFTTALQWSLSWDRSIQSLPIHPISLRSTLILPSHLRLGRSSGLFPSTYHIKTLYALLFSPCVLHEPHISCSFTRTFLVSLAKSTIYEAPHYAVFSNLLLLHLSSVQIFFSAPCSQTPSVNVFPTQKKLKFS